MVVQFGLPVIIASTLAWMETTVMMSFRGGRLQREAIPMSVARLVDRIGECKGKQQLFAQQSPQLLESLRQCAIVQSTESSNRIEGIVVPSRKLHELMDEKVAPANRSEGEVAGYRDVLSTIHANYKEIEPTPNIISQLHRDLYRYVPSEGGHWKSVDNTIDDVLSDGTHVVRFHPVPAVATPLAMQELCDALKRHTQAEDVVPLLLVGTFVLDFLCIHPFRDGNGRMARLLALLLLYQHGYEVGRYISLERVIEESRDSYYETLKLSSEHWHEGKHNLVPWWEYFLGTIYAAYEDFERRVGVMSTGRGVKSALVRQMVGRMGGEFTLTELAQRFPNISRETVRNVLENMKAQGEVECLKTGRSSRWRRRVEKVEPT